MNWLTRVVAAIALAGLLTGCAGFGQMTVPDLPVHTDSQLD